MAVLRSDFTDQSVLIYDLAGNHLGSSTVTDHDRGAQHIQVSLMPDELKVNDDCKLLIITSPSPCEFLGKVKKVGGNLFIAMFQGQEKENRTSVRYAVSTVAIIDSLIIDGKLNALHTPVRVALINISTSGVRFRAPYYSLENGDEFRMHLTISNSNKVITAKVINFLDKEPNFSDYGCRFLEIE